MSVFYLFARREYSGISRNIKENLLPGAFLFLSGSNPLFKFAFARVPIKVIHPLEKIKAT
jgi:hypothetical protein